MQIDIHPHPWGWVEETTLGEILFPLRLLPQWDKLGGVWRSLPEYTVLYCASAGLLY